MQCAIQPRQSIRILTGNFGSSIQRNAFSRKSFPTARQDNGEGPCDIWKNLP
jgi:hypothetical protein